MKIMNNSWEEAVEDAYKLGMKEHEEGIDFCFNPYETDVNSERKEAWAKGWMNNHEMART